MIAVAVKTFGGVDIMVNNAGYTHKDSRCSMSARRTSIAFSPST